MAVATENCRGRTGSAGAGTDLIEKEGGEASSTGATTAVACIRQAQAVHSWRGANP